MQKCDFGKSKTIDNEYRFSYLNWKLDWKLSLTLELSLGHKFYVIESIHCEKMTTEKVFQTYLKTHKSQNISLSNPVQIFEICVIFVI